jgi:hypothetical protein
VNIEALAMKQIKSALLFPTQTQPILEYGTYFDHLVFVVKLVASLKDLVMNYPTLYLGGRPCTKLLAAQTI